MAGDAPLEHVAFWHASECQFHTFTHGMLLVLPHTNKHESERLTTHATVSIGLATPGNCKASMAPIAQLRNIKIGVLVQYSFRGG